MEAVTALIAHLYLTHQEVKTDDTFSHRKIYNKYKSFLMTISLISDTPLSSMLLLIYFHLGNS